MLDDTTHVNQSGRKRNTVHVFTKDTMRLRNFYTVSQSILCTPAEAGTAAVSATPAAVSDTDVRYCGAEVK